MFVEEEGERALDASKLRLREALRLRGGMRSRIGEVLDNEAGIE